LGTAINWLARTGYADFSIEDMADETGSAIVEINEMIDKCFEVVAEPVN
jgi:hypothetical protein